MLEYELSQILHIVGPYLINTFSVISGIIISNIFWKARIYRYASATILKTMEYQSNKIEYLESDIRIKDNQISDLRGSLKVAKIAALKIVGIVK